MVWRRLRGLGAVYLQQSVSLLPDLPAMQQSFGPVARAGPCRGWHRPTTARLTHRRERATGAGRGLLAGRRQ
ncbi:MAG: Chromate resistance protein ChrB [Mycobacteriales bacterium]